MKIKVNFNSLVDVTNSYINLGNYQEDIANLLSPNEIVIPMQSIKVIFDLYLSNTIIHDFNANMPEGFTREYLAHQIGDKYRQLYQQEEENQNIPGMAYSGAYEICVEDLDSLLLHTVQQERGNLFILGIDT